MTRALTVLLSSLLLTAAVAAAQQPPPAAAPAAPAPQAQAAAPAAESPATESPAYTYDPQGRRDPFISLLRRGSDAERARQAMRIAGISGLEVGEISLKGTMQSRSGYVALVSGADGKTYIVKPGDRLLDGTVRNITPSAMVIMQQVNDPLSLEKQREVRKMLRQTDEVK